MMTTGTTLFGETDFGEQPGSPQTIEMMVAREERSDAGSSDTLQPGGSVAG